MGKWLSWESILLILTTPAALFVSTLQFYFVGPGSRKLKNNLGLHLRRFLAKRVGQVPDKDISILTSYSIAGLIKRFQKNYPTIAARLPGLGEEYDAFSSWVVKAPNRKPSDPIAIYLHGGGYAFQAAPAHLHSVISVFELLEPEKRENLSILFLDYRLAGQGHHFPAGVEDLHETYKKLTLDDKNSNIILWGDSAGGNLALVYLQHLKRAALKEHFTPVYPKNLLLLSPWVRVKPPADAFTKGRSWYEADGEDLLTHKKFSSPELLNMVFKPVIDSLDDVTVSPLSTPFNRSDWDDIPTMSGDILFIVGDTEGFRDDILEFSEKLYGCPFYKENLDHYNNRKSEGKFDASIHEYVRKTKNGKVGFKLLVDAWGNHCSTITFEVGAIDKLQHRGKVGIKDFDPVLYFGTTRMAEYLNETL